MIKEPVDEINVILVPPSVWNCKSRIKVVYLVYCRLCRKLYTGRTVQTCSDKVSGHSSCFYKVSERNEDVDSNSDDYSLGLYIANEHAYMIYCLYNVQILENCSLST